LLVALFVVPAAVQVLEFGLAANLLPASALVSEVLIFFPQLPGIV
jgi:hypothetical protein